MPYEYLDHQADLGIRGMGETPQEALSAGAQAMLAAIANLDTVRCTQTWTQRCTAPDIGALFVEWLNELLYQREIHGALFVSAQVIDLEQRADGWVLTGTVCGEPLALDRHEIYTEVKAATYSGLGYGYCSEKGCYVVQCVVDV